MKGKISNTGLLLEDGHVPFIHSEKDWFLGSVLDHQVVFPDGHGVLQFQPQPRPQFNRNFDSFSCVVFGIAKSLCYSLKRKYNIDVDISEMFSAVMAKVTPGRGTTIRLGMEAFRLDGFLYEHEMPFTDKTTQDEWFSQKPMTLVIKARDRVRGENAEFEINWESICDSTNIPHELIADALKYGNPIVVTGYAWASFYGARDGEIGVYKDYGYNANHCFLVADHNIDGKDSHVWDLLADDSYPQDFQYDGDYPKQEFLKKLAPDYRIWSAHRIHIKKIGATDKTSLITKIKNMFSKIKRDTKGGLWFVKKASKDGTDFMGKQKLEGWLDFAGAVIDEIGCETVKDAELRKCLDYKFFGK